VYSTVVTCWALILVAVLSQQPPSSTASGLNYEYFKAKVQPIFLNKRPGHARCVSCHSDATPFRLQPLQKGRTTWNEEESLKNFEAAKRMVVPGSLKSPLLAHPLLQTAGGDFFHSGGKQFDSQDDPEWQAMKAWVLGKTGVE
jgi:hypothetical protein